MNEEELLERKEKLEEQLETKIKNKELTECEDCGWVFEYSPRKKLCEACLKKRRYLRQKDYAKRDYVVAKRKTPEAIAKKKAYDYTRNKRDEEE